MHGRSIPISVLILMFASTAFAFDGERKGFILGGAIGPSVTSVTQELSWTSPLKSDRENKFGFGTDFKIGYGINEQWLVYYVNRVTWFAFEEKYTTQSGTVANAVGLFGVSFYFETNAPTFYLLGLVGLSNWSEPFERNGRSLTGFGFGAGAGWEFSPHWSLEGTVNYGEPSGTVYGMEFTVEAISVLLVIAGLAY